MTAPTSMQMPRDRLDRNGHEIRPGMWLAARTGSENRMYVISLPSLYVVEDQGSREANLTYAAECIRTGQGELYPLDFLNLKNWEIER